MSIGEILGIACLLIGGVAVLAWRISARRSRIWLKTLDEVAVVRELMFSVADKVTERRTQFQLGSTLMTDGIAALQSITREELVILAPYIDDWIAGRLPPRNLPAEYEDYRPRVLLGFKQRLQSNGQWPLAYSRKRFAVPEKRA